MVKRKVIKIDEDKCNGCGLCIPNCPEGALKIIDGKVRLISDASCDGLGACIGHCPEGAITIEERDAEGYNESKVIENIAKQGRNVIREHLAHLKEHGEEGYLKEALKYLRENGIEVPVGEAAPHEHRFEGCPGLKVVDLRKKEEHKKASAKPHTKEESELRQWPIQIKLVSPSAPYLKGSDLLIAADCVPFAYADFHRSFLRGKTLMVGCPKLDNLESYREKITQILKNDDIKSITYAHMEVPCCSGLIDVIRSAITSSGKKIPFEDVTITISGETAR